MHKKGPTHEAHAQAVGRLLARLHQTNGRAEPGAVRHQCDCCRGSGSSNPELELPGQKVSQLAGPQGKAVPQHQRHHNGRAPFIEAPHHIEPGLEIIVSNVRCVNSLRPNRSQAGGWSELRTRRRSHAAAARHRGAEGADRHLSCSGNRQLGCPRL